MYDTLQGPYAQAMLGGMEPSERTDTLKMRYNSGAVYARLQTSQRTAEAELQADLSARPLQSNTIIPLFQLNFSHSFVVLSVLSPLKPLSPLT